MAVIASAQAYRRAPFGPNDPLFHRCLIVSSAIGLGFLLAVFLWPARPQAVLTVEQLPPRIARLILEKPKAAAPGPAAQATIEQSSAPEAPAQVETPKPAPPPPRARRVEPAKPLAPNAGQVGRSRATKEVATRLEKSTEALDRSLKNLSSSLASSSPTAATQAPAGRRRSRGVRSGRSGAEVGAVATDVAGTGALVDLGGSTVAGSRISIGELGGTGGGGVEGGSGTEGGTGGGTGALPGVYRSNASLLAIIQRYAAGIQYCYGNELKRDPGLKGKLVVALTVSASGAVTEATIVENTVGSSRLAQCALSQIREWKFPAISGGSTSFQTPFVFTPPN